MGPAFFGLEPFPGELFGLVFIEFLAGEDVYTTDLPPQLRRDMPYNILKLFF